MEERELIRSCLKGNKKSLEELIRSIQGLVFNLSLRFLWNRMDAEDATQEILIKIITNLGRFDGKSRFSTWAYRVATNHLLNLKQTALEKVFSSFDAFANDLMNTKDVADYNLPDKDLMEKELKTGCTLAMLQCLDRDLRIAFILGTVFKLKSNTASYITQTTPENFRKRLELSRKLIGNFLHSYCGVYRPANQCRCNKRIHGSVNCGRIRKGKLNFADKIDQYNNEMEELHSLSAIYQNHGFMKSDSEFIGKLNDLIQTKNIVIGN